MSMKARSSSRRMSESLYERARKDLAPLVKDEDTVVAGVSGGADSLCLFILLKSLLKPGQLKVMHVHHHLRDNADGDEAFVRALCEKEGIGYRRADVDVEALVRERGLSTEEAARELRYAAMKAWLSELEPEPGRRKLAVAHTLNDNAETVLHNLFRGSGLKGLGGIRPIAERDGYMLIRPLLNFSREEIEGYLNSSGMSWRCDESNESDAYARNRIRRHLLPAAAEMVNPSAALHVHEAALKLSSAEDFISSALAEAHDSLVSPSENGGLRIDRRGFLALHPYLRSRLAVLCMEEVSGSAKDITALHASLFEGLFSLPCGKMLDLPHRLHALRCREYVELVSKE